jgi:hypothetical protein
MSVSDVVLYFLPDPLFIQKVQVERTKQGVI